jgi:hypothetical protein
MVASSTYESWMETQKPGAAVTEDEWLAAHGSA